MMATSRRIRRTRPALEPLEGRIVLDDSLTTASYAGVVTQAATARGALAANITSMAAPTIEVEGTGRVAAPPDVADVQVGVVTQGATAREALAANNASMTALFEVLRRGGVADRDIQTVLLDVSPRYAETPTPTPPGWEPKIIGYEVTNSVQVTVRDVPNLGVLLDAAVQAGANQIQGISLQISEPEKLLDEARKRAMDDARRKADLYATAAGMAAGSPVSIQEEAGPSPQPVPVALQSVSGEVPIARGEQELVAKVHVVYELQPAPGK